LFARARRVLHHGSGLPRLRAAVSLPRGRQLLCDPRQGESQSETTLLSSLDRATGLICDQIVVLTGFCSRKGFEAPLRRICFKDPETAKTLIFLTNNFALPALTITELYRCRCQVELSFKWIKQHLRIKAFFGTSENAVQSQIWIAVSVYVLVAIIKKRLKLSATLYEILQILSLTMFERMPVDQLLAQTMTDDIARISDKQLILFE
jgi:Transposase DDE domain.